MRYFRKSFLPAMTREFCLFFLLCLVLSDVSGQNEKKRDTIYIKFEEKLDKIDTSKRVFKTSAFHIKNVDYNLELLQYKKEITKFKEGEPYYPYPLKPNEYYSFFKIAESRVREKNDLNNIFFLNRSQLDTLTPYHKTIYVVKTKKDSIELHEVSFSKLGYE